MIFGSTRGAVNHLLKVAKCVAFIAAMIMQLLYIVYLVYIVAKGEGIVGVNIAMLVVSFVYLAYFLVMEYRLSGMTGAEKRAERKSTKIMKRVYNWVKFAFKTMNLGIMLYGLWVNEAISTTVSTIFTTLMIIVWIVEFVIALGTLVLGCVVDIIFDAVEDDKNALKDRFIDEPKRVAKRGINRFKRLLGFGSPDDDCDDSGDERYIRKERYVRWEEELKEKQARERAEK